jgi:hypothetical protein
MSSQIPDLWDTCYEGEHRSLKSPVQFKNEFCAICMNVGCRNSRGAGTKWNQRMMNQEDRLLTNPQFAPDNAAKVLGLPDFKNMIQEALRIEISTKRNDWEPVSDAEVGRAAAEMLGVVPPKSFQAVADPTPTEPDTAPDPVEDPKPVQSQWKIRGRTLDRTGKPLTYVVTQHEDGTWGCTCPSREVPCKHAREIQGRIRPPESPKPPPSDPVRPPPVSRRMPFPSALNTSPPQGGVMIGGAQPPPPEHDPWAAPARPKERKIEVGGRVTFGTNKKK